MYINKYLNKFFHIIQDVQKPCPNYFTLDDSDR